MDSEDLEKLKNDIDYSLNSAKYDYKFCKQIVDKNPSDINIKYLTAYQKQIHALQSASFDIGELIAEMKELDESGKGKSPSQVSDTTK